jgi:phosphoribosyl 1,2-cyclic phosphodiesterase
MIDRADVLIVDHAATADRLVALCIEEGLRAVRTGKPGEVLRMVRRHRPQVMVLEFRLRGLDGPGLCRTIKGDPALRDTRILVASSEDSAAEQGEARAVGAEAFLPKPIAPQAVVQQIKEMLAEVLTVHLWGTRGSIPTPGPDTVRYGGNTACVAVRLSTGRLLVFDAGSGIVPLGRALSKEGRPLDVDIFLSHFHWDHIQGLPFFAPAYRKGNVIRIYGCDRAEVPLHSIIATQMESVYFPVPLQTLAADIQFQSLTEGRYTFDTFAMDTLFLQHPGTTLGFRLRRGGKSVAYLTDNELGPIEGKPSAFVRQVADFVRGADLLIHDAQYTRDEYHLVRGWGHSCYEDVVTLAEMGGVRRLAFFHHDPERTDDEIDALVRTHGQPATDSGVPQSCFGARDGMQIEL